MAREKTSKKQAGGGKPAKAAPAAATGKRKAPKAGKAPKVRKVVDGARKLAANPAVTEVVAATLVAAAAALRDPKKARAMAAEAASELRQAAKSGAEGGALWQLALDVAQRSMDTLGTGKPKKKKAGSKKKK